MKCKHHRPHPWMQTTNGSIMDFNNFFFVMFKFCNTHISYVASWYWIFKIWMELMMFWIKTFIFTHTHTNFLILFVCLFVAKTWYYYLHQNTNICIISFDFVVRRQNPDGTKSWLFLLLLLLNIHPYFL